MKILFTTRASLFSQPGGDTLQVVQTAEALRAKGHQADIFLRGEKVDIESYDLVHFFNLGRPADLVEMLPRIQQPLIVSSIWVNYSEFDHQRSGTVGTIRNIFGYDAVEYAKTLARGINSSDRLPGWNYLKQGHHESMRLIAERAQAVITSSASEKKRITNQLTKKANCMVVPLGLSEEYFKPFIEEERQGVICVGRIEGIKNQLNLVHAAHGATWNLRIIGKPALNQKEYYHQCKKAATNNIEFVGWLDGENLLQAYRKAKVLVLPSYFETFGLVALEAMSQGCNIVIADRPDMNSIFGDRAPTFNPNSPQEIREKIELSLQLPVNKLSENEIKIHSWETIGNQILDIYKSVLET